MSDEKMNALDYPVIDRRPEGSKSSQENLRRYQLKHRSQINRQILDGILSQDNFITDPKKKYKIHINPTEEPFFQFDQGSGQSTYSIVGNKRYVRGDRIPKPKQSNGQGQGKGGKGEAGNGEPGEDDYSIELSLEDILNILFEECELPSFVKKSITSSTKTMLVRKGFTPAGVKRSTEQTFKKSIKRRIAMGGKNPLTPEERLRMVELADKLKRTQEEENEYQTLLEKRQSGRQKASGQIIPFFSDDDETFVKNEPEIIPESRGVLFCVMDVSGSMNQQMKYHAQLFFMIIYHFLSNRYEQMDIRFIRHHTQAKEVSQEEFFSSKETGGTFVSPALKLVNEIIDADYPLETTNIYVSQCSDGDNFPQDLSGVEEQLPALLNKLQYMTYLQVHEPNDMRLHVADQQNLWQQYQKFTDEKFVKAIASIPSEVIKGFYDFFRKEA